MMPSHDEEIFRAASLCVVGNLNRDLRTAPFPAGDYLFCDGETGVASIRETIGGGGANSAVAAASLGAKVAFVGKAGRDDLGRRLEEMLRHFGVRALLNKDPRCATGTSINLVFDSGHRHFVSCLPNNESLSFEELDLSALAEYHHLCRSDVWFSESMLYGGNERLFRHAKAAGMAISIDLNWDPHWGIASTAEVSRRKAAIRQILPLVDLAHGNVRELNEIAEGSDLNQTLERLLGWGVRGVVIHMGAQGAGYYENGSLVVERAVAPVRCVNTTGTGDVLSVCMMLLHAESSISTREKLQLANRIVCEFIEGTRDFHVPPERSA